MLGLIYKQQRQEALKVMVDRARKDFPRPLRDYVVDMGAMAEDLLYGDHAIEILSACPLSWSRIDSDGLAGGANDDPIYVTLMLHRRGVESADQRSVNMGQQYCRELYDGLAAVVGDLPEDRKTTAQHNMHVLSLSLHLIDEMRKIHNAFIQFQNNINAEGNPFLAPFDTPEIEL